MDDYLQAISDERGVFLRRELVALGHTDRSIATAVRRQHFHRVRHGAYLLGRDWEQLDPGRRHLVTGLAAARTADTPVVLSHTTSLMHFETPWWDLPLDDVHLTRRDGHTGRSEAGVRQHRGTLLDGDVVEKGEFAFMSATRTLLEVTTLTDVERALVVANGLLHAGETQPQLVKDRYALMGHWPYTLRTDLVIRLSHPKVASAGESRCFYLFYRAGLPLPEPQYELRDERGELIAALDFAWPQFGVFVEFDGRIKYDGVFEDEPPRATVLREKRRQEWVEELTGWRCIRITWADLQRPEQTIARLRRALAAGPRRRPA